VAEVSGGKHKLHGTLAPGVAFTRRSLSLVMDVFWASIHEHIAVQTIAIMNVEPLH